MANVIHFEELMCKSIKFPSHKKITFEYAKNLQEAVFITAKLTNMYLSDSESKPCASELRTFICPDSEYSGLFGLIRVFKKQSISDTKQDFADEQDSEQDSDDDELPCVFTSEDLCHSLEEVYNLKSSYPYSGLFDSLEGSSEDDSHSQLFDIEEEHESSVEDESEEDSEDYQRDYRLNDVSLWAHFIFHEPHTVSPVCTLL